MEVLKIVPFLGDAVEIAVGLRNLLKNPVSGFFEDIIDETVTTIAQKLYMDFLNGLTATLAVLFGDPKDEVMLTDLVGFGLRQLQELRKSPNYREIFPEEAEKIIGKAVDMLLPRFGRPPDDATFDEN